MATRKVTFELSDKHILLLCNLVPGLNDQIPEIFQELRENEQAFCKLGEIIRAKDPSKMQNHSGPWVIFEDGSANNKQLRIANLSLGYLWQVVIDRSASPFQLSNNIVTVREAKALLGKTSLDNYKVCKNNY